MAKFNLATSKNMKLYVFNLAVAARRASFSAQKAALELEKLNREGNSRDIDTSEISTALALAEDAANTLQNIQGTLRAAVMENNRLSATTEEKGDLEPDTSQRNRAASLDRQIDLFYKLSIT